MAKSRYYKSHLIDAKYFIQDTKHKLVGEYQTNSHGKRVASASLKGVYGTTINFSSYQELKSAKEMLDKLLKETRGKWISLKEEAKGGE